MANRRIWALLCLAYWPAISSAALDPTDVIQIQATGSLIHDNNLFRLPDLDPNLFGIPPENKSDTTRILGIGLKLDKPISRQRLVADLNLNDVKYRKNSNLDYVGGDGRLGWIWQLGNHWSGEASYRKRRTLAGFADFRQAIQDLVDTETVILSAGYQFHPRWRISVDASELESTHSAATRRQFDYDATTVGTEVRYSTPSRNTLALQARQTDRSYPTRSRLGIAAVDHGHRETRLNAVGAWQVSGAVKIDAQLGHVDVGFDTLSQRDFSGNTWKTAATWEPTAKTRLSLNLFKDVRLYEDVATTYVVVNGFGFSPTYAIAPKVLLQGDAVYEKREFRGDPSPGSITPDREDTTRLARIGVTYTPIRNIDLSLSYEIGSRRSNTLGLAFISGVLTPVKSNEFDYQSWFATMRIGF